MSWCSGTGTFASCWQIMRPTTTPRARILRSTRILHFTDRRRPSAVSRQSPGSVVSTNNRSVGISGRHRYRVYDAALGDLGLSSIHRRGKRLNNRAESSHVPIRRRERKAGLSIRRIGTTFPFQPLSQLQHIQRRPSSDHRQHPSDSAQRRLRYLEDRGHCLSLTTHRCCSALAYQRDKPHDCAHVLRSTRHLHSLGARVGVIRNSGPAAERWRQRLLH
jgi:hypothetical protein